MSGTTKYIRPEKSIVWRILLWIAVVLLGVALMTGWWRLQQPYPRNNLASDEELIVYFYAHRADIEELVKRYREYEPPPGQDHSILWMKQGDTEALLKRAGLRYIQYSLGVWLPNPYSLETGKQVAAIPGFEKYIKHGTISVRVNDDRFVRNTIWKDLIFIPVVPRVENGILLYPISERGKQSRHRVLPTLNSEPPKVQRDECALRQIEPQWFIQMCRVID